MFNFFRANPKSNFKEWAQKFALDVKQNKGLADYESDLSNKFAEILFDKEEYANEKQYFIETQLPSIIKTAVANKNAKSKVYEKFLQRLMDLINPIIAYGQYENIEMFLPLFDSRNAYYKQYEKNYSTIMQYYFNNHIENTIAAIANTEDYDKNKLYEFILQILKEFVDSKKIPYDDIKDAATPLVLRMFDELAFLPSEVVGKLVDIIKNDKNELSPAFATRFYDIVSQNPDQASNYTEQILTYFEKGINFENTTLWQDVASQIYKDDFVQGIFQLLNQIIVNLDLEEAINTMMVFNPDMQARLMPAIVAKSRNINKKDAFAVIETIFGAFQTNIPWNVITIIVDSLGQNLPADVCKLVTSKIVKTQKINNDEIANLVSALITKESCDIDSRRNLFDAYFSYITTGNNTLSNTQKQSILAYYRSTYTRKQVIEKLTTQYLKNENKDLISTLLLEVLQDRSQYQTAFQESSSEIRLQLATIHVQSDNGIRNVVINLLWSIDELIDYFSALEGLKPNEFELQKDNKKINQFRTVKDLKLTESNLLTIKYKTDKFVQKMALKVERVKSTKMQPEQEIISVPSNIKILDLQRIIRIVFGLKDRNVFKLKNRNIANYNTLFDLDIDKSDPIVISDDIEEEDEEDDISLPFEFIKQLITNDPHNKILVNVNPPREILDKFNNMDSFIEFLMSQDQDTFNYLLFVLREFKEKQISDFLSCGGYNILVDTIINGRDLTATITDIIKQQVNMDYKIKELINCLFLKPMREAADLLKYLYRTNTSKVSLPDKDILKKFLQTTENYDILNVFPPNMKLVLTQYCKDDMNSFYKLFELICDKNSSFDDIIACIKIKESEKEKLFNIISNMDLSDKQKETLYDIFFSCISKYQIIILQCIEDFVVPDNKIGLMIDSINKAKFTKFNMAFDQSTQGSSFVGLINLGNTCYANSTIQQLFFCDRFLDFITNQHYDNEELKATQNVFNVLNEKKEKKFRMDDFAEKCSVLGDDIRIYEYQQDAQEFLTGMLDKIKGSENIFGFKKRTQIKHGQTMEVLSDKTDPEIMLHLQVGDYSTFEESVAEIFKEEQIQDYEYNKKKITVRKTDTFQELKENLICHLQRFRFDNGNAEKITSRFEFPLEFNSNIIDKNSNFKYKLHGVVAHIGEAFGGHYISFARTNKGWFQLDDDNNWEISDNEFRTRTIGGSNQEFCAYVLFYSIDDFRKVSEDATDEMNPNVFVSNEFTDFALNQTNEEFLMSYITKVFIRGKGTSHQTKLITDIIETLDQEGFAKVINENSFDLIDAISGSTQESIIELCSKMLKKAMDNNTATNVLDSLPNCNWRAANYLAEPLRVYIEKNSDKYLQDCSKIIQDTIENLKKKIPKSQRFDFSTLEEILKMTKVFSISTKKQAEQFLDDLTEDEIDLDEIFEKKQNSVPFFKYFQEMVIAPCLRSKTYGKGHKILNWLGKINPEETFLSSLDCIIHEKRPWLAKPMSFLTLIIDDLIKLVQDNKDIADPEYFSDVGILFVKIRTELPDYDEDELDECYFPIKYMDPLISTAKLLMQFGDSSWKKTKFLYDNGKESKDIEFDPDESLDYVFWCLSFFNKDSERYQDSAKLVEFMLNSVINGNTKLLTVLEGDLAQKIIQKNISYPDFGNLFEKFLIASYSKFNLLPNYIHSMILLEKKDIPAQFLHEERQDVIETFVNNVIKYGASKKRPYYDSLIKYFIKMVGENSKFDIKNVFTLFIRTGIAQQEYYISFEISNPLLKLCKKYFDKKKTLDEIDDFLAMVYEVYSDLTSKYRNVVELMASAFKAHYNKEDVSYKKFSELLINNNSKLKGVIINECKIFMNKDIPASLIKQDSSEFEEICSYIMDRDKEEEDIGEYSDIYADLMYMCRMIEQYPKLKEQMILTQEYIDEKYRNNEYIMKTLF